VRRKTLADEGFSKFRKKTRKDSFVDEMERILLWKELSATIEPLDPNRPGAGRWV
jgi:IS5 family transposase